MVLAYLITAGMSRIGKMEETSCGLVVETFKEVLGVVDPDSIAAASACLGALKGESTWATRSSGIS